MHGSFAGTRYDWRREWRRTRARRRAFGFAGLATLIAALGAAGCGGERRGHWRDEHRSATRQVDRALDWLDLEGAARERARVAAVRLAGEADGMRADATRLADEALAQWQRDQPDAAALHRVLDEQLEALRARAHRVVDDALELHATLDAEQRAEVGDALAWHEDGRRRHHHRW